MSAEEVASSATGPRANESDVKVGPKWQPDRYLVPVVLPFVGGETLLQKLESEEGGKMA